MFQSSPRPKTGCYLDHDPQFPIISSFNPHPARRRGATPRFFPSTAILTVSILTPPEDGVLHVMIVACGSAASTFQSSPRPKTGCYTPLHLIQTMRTFQSSPRPKTGCYVNPAGECPVNDRFQSSPRPKTGCYRRNKSERRAGLRFQSSPRPKTGCYQSPCSGTRRAGSFNPHPARRRGATAGFATPVFMRIRSVSCANPSKLLSFPFVFRFVTARNPMSCGRLCDLRTSRGFHPRLRFARSMRHPIQTISVNSMPTGRPSRRTSTW